MLRPTIIALAAAATACAMPSEGYGDMTQAVPSAGRGEADADPLALVAESGGAGHPALLTGRLMLEGGCLYVVTDRGERWIPVFRSPLTRWNAAARSVETSYGETWRVGETVRLSGGMSRPRTCSKAPPAGCSGGNFWLVSAPFVPEPG